MQDVQEVIAYAKSFIGIPYIWGGDSPMAGFDCSGLVLEVLKAYGVCPNSIDMNSQSIHNTLKLSGNKTLVDPEPGALLFFGKNKDSITHVAIALDDRLMLEAGGGDSTTTTIKAATARGAFVRIRPMKNRKDLVAIILPKY